MTTAEGLAAAVEAEGLDDDAYIEMMVMLIRLGIML